MTTKELNLKVAEAMPEDLDKRDENKEFFGRLFTLRNKGEYYAG